MRHKKYFNIGLVPSIKETYKNQLEYSFDLRMNNLFKAIFKNYNLFIINNIKQLKIIDLVIFIGGNDLSQFVRKRCNFKRNKLDVKILKASLNKKKRILGICYGAQIISHFFKSKLYKKKHVGSHKIKLIEKDSIKKVKVNSFHNYVITKLGFELTPIAIANDQTIEAFLHKTKKILGIMWHPERYKKIKKLDVYLIKKYLCN